MRASYVGYARENTTNDDGGQHMDEKKNIDLGGGYRLAVRDERNWKLQHWHEPDESNPKTTRSGARWYDTGNYFQTVGAALAFVFERRMREEGEPDEALADAMERAERIRNELTGVVS